MNRPTIHFLPVRYGFMLVTATLLSGCMLTGQVSPVSMIAPDIETAVDPDWPRVEWSLQVQRPEADRMRDSDRLMVRVSGSRLQSFPESAWLDNMPDMVQSLMIRHFEDSRRFGGVGRAGMRGRFSLASEIRHFEAVDDGQDGLGVHLSVHVNLLHPASGRIVASHTFSQRVRAPGTTLDPLIAAFEQAMGALLADLTGWVLAEGERASKVP